MQSNAKQSRSLVISRDKKFVNNKGNALVFPGKKSLVKANFGMDGDILRTYKSTAMEELKCRRTRTRVRRAYLVQRPTDSPLLRKSDLESPVNCLGQLGDIQALQKSCAQSESCVRMEMWDAFEIERSIFPNRGQHCPAFVRRAHARFLPGCFGLPFDMVKTESIIDFHEILLSIMTMLRSVHDYPNEESLRRALQTPIEVDAANAEESPLKRQDNGLDPRLEWVVEGYDKENSHPQALEQELRRLAVLKSYRISGSGRHKECERLLSLICRLIDTPMALVSVMDLGFQHLIATRGLQDWKEVPRKACICSHTLISKLDMMIIPDLSKDDRFKDYGAVTNFPFVRFYASNPLVSPEGYRLGTVCVLDSVPRPKGLTFEEKQNLREITDMVMDAMVEHREIINHQLRNPSQVIACTANDLLTPLKGVMNGLGTIQQDEKLIKTMTKQQREVFNTARSCSSVMNRICKRSLKTFEKGHPFSTSDTSETETEDESSHLLDIKTLVKHLHMVMEPFPKQVPLIITVDPSVPRFVVADSLKIFRSAVNFLTNACGQTERGSVHLSIHVEKGESIKRDLVFSVEDSGPGISVDQYQYLFKPTVVQPKKCVSRDGNDSSSKCTDASQSFHDEMDGAEGHNRKGMGLYLVASDISSIGGKYGFQPREFTDTGIPSFNASGQPATGSRFWFSIPLTVPEEDEFHSDPLQHQFEPFNSIKVKDSPNEVINKSAKIDHRRDLDVGMKLSPTGRRRRALIIDDSLTCRKALMRQLLLHGFETVEAADGMEGLKAMQEILFDVVFCDFLMPVLDGIDCVQQYRYFEARARPWFDQFIVGISGHANEANVDRGLKVGMNDFKPKPITDENLIEILQGQDFEQVSSRLDAIEAELEPKQQQSLPLKKLSTLNTEPPRPIYCLIAEEGNALSTMAEKEAKVRALQTVRVHDNETALQLLKMRNWDAVFLDSDMAGLLSSKCVSVFREWEKRNRVKRQKNIVQVSSSFIPKFHDSSSVQLPTGFDAVMGKPISAEVLFSFLDDIARGNSVACKSSDIL